MHIQEVCKRTNLSKKAIYYYMDEKLITPIKNSENGYHEFTLEDVEILKKIAILRQLGMSVQTIQEVFQYPEMFNFFMHRHYVDLKSRITEMLTQLSDVNYFLEAFPPNATPDNLSSLYQQFTKEKITSDNQFLEYAYPSKDARMVAILLWGSFLEIRAGEYHQYLWSKMAKLLSTHMAEATTYVSQFIYSLEPAIIQDICKYQYQMSLDLQQNTPELLSRYEKLLIEACEHLASSEELQQYWTLTYSKILLPLANFNYHHANNLMKEYNPRFSAYQMNLMHCAHSALDTIKKTNPDLITALQKKLEGKLHLDDFDYLELSTILQFEHSLFTALPLEKLSQIMETNLKD